MNIDYGGFSVFSSAVVVQYQLLNVDSKNLFQKIMVSYLNVVPLIKLITLMNIVSCFIYALFLLLYKQFVPLLVENEVKYFIYSSGFSLSQALNFSAQTLASILGLTTSMPSSYISFLSS